MISFESILDDKNAYLFYIIFELAFCVLTWLWFNFFFEIRKPEEIGGENQAAYEKMSTNETKTGTDRT